MENIAKSICNICMEADLALEISGIVKPCMHTYCFNCIEKWLKCKYTCPNCLVTITKLCKKTQNVVEELEIIAKVSNDDTKQKENFDCLDHEYFKTEVKNLEKRLNKIILILSKNTKDFDIENKWKLIEEFRRKVKSKNEIIQNLEHFHPEQFLNEIYDLDSIFLKIELNKWNEINLEEYIESFLPKKFCDENNLIVDDYYCEDDYYDDEYDEHLYYGRKYSTQIEINNFKKTQQKLTNDNKKKKPKKKNKTTEI